MKRDSLVDQIDARHRRMSAEQHSLLELIVQADIHCVWEGSGARDMAHWLCMRYDMSEWKARRWIAAAYALETLPRVAEALAAGELGIDKVVELTRLATPETEADLVRWASTVSGA